MNVSNGAYAVRLGDSAQAPPISDAVLRGVVPLKLRVLFDRSEKGWAAAGADALLTRDKPPEAIGGGNETSAILSELREIHALLAGKQGGTQPQTPEIVTVPIAGAPSLGNADAPLVLVEFTDFQCTFCVKFHNEAFEQLKTQYVAAGKLRVVSHHVPLPFHQFAEPAARAAHCAEAQGKFWQMRERLFAANGTLSDDTIKQAAQDAKLDMVQFEACFTSKETAAAVQNDMQQAKVVGIEATPTFVLGKVVEGTVTGLKIIGAQPFTSFEAEIKKQLPPEKQP